MNTLTLMVGISGSGKSTYAKTFAKNLANTEYVSRDEIRFKLLEAEGESQYFGVEKRVFKEFVIRIIKGLEEGKHVIADATHLTPSSRLKLLKALNMKPDVLQALVMDTPLNVCLERNSQRKGLARVPDEVIRNMHDSFIPVTHKEGKFIYDLIMIKGEEEPLWFSHYEY